MRAWTEWRVGLRAWWRTGAGPWITAGTDARPADLAAFRRHNAALGVRRIRWLVLALIGLNLTGWATDATLLDVIPGVQPALGEGRAAMTVFGALIAGLASLPVTRRPAMAVVLGWLGAIGLCGGIAFTMGRIGGPSTAWFHYSYLFPFVSLMAWAAPWHRTALVVTLTGVILVTYFGLHPAHWADPLAGSAITHLLFIDTLLLLIGLLFDATRLRLFLFARASHRESDRLEAMVARQTARIVGLLDHQERAREDERRAIAAELHDEMGQVLTGMRLTLRVARTRAVTDGNPLSGALEQLGEMMQHLGWAVRNLLVRLRPRVLDDLGFVAAAEWLAHQTDELPGQRCTFMAEPDLPELDADGATAAFRVLQEALTNAIRHAAADHIKVRLAAEAGGLKLTITDDGQGFDAADASGGGMGQLGMRERARAQGGRLEIRSAPGQGTRVILKLPSAGIPPEPPSEP
ncbi:MAG: sensor histidine kinase [Myxococcales bacterium]|nr:sensor histidine kinase [Myxococcales bacterium]